MASGGHLQNSPPRFMIVYDEKDILVILKSGLEAKGALAGETFSSGETALQALASHSPDYYDLVLADISMSKMNGFGLYQKIRDKNTSILVAFITTFEIEFSKLMPSIKVRDFIKKPIRIPDLIEKLNAILAAA